MSLKDELCTKLDIFTSADVSEKYVDYEIIRRIDDMILLHKVIENHIYSLRNTIDELDASLSDTSGYLNNLEKCLKQLK